MTRYYDVLRGHNFYKKIYIFWQCQISFRCYKENIADFVELAIRKKLDPVTIHAGTND